MDNIMGGSPFRECRHQILLFRVRKLSEHKKVLQFNVLGLGLGLGLCGLGRWVVGLASDTTLKSNRPSPR